MRRNAVVFGVEQLARTSAAARVGDAHACPKHGAGNGVSGSTDVTVNGRAFARTGDQTLCQPMDYIVTGSRTVRVNGKPVGRVGSLSLHGGEVTEGSPNVRVGGPDEGGTLGNPAKAKAACDRLRFNRAYTARYQRPLLLNVPPSVEARVPFLGPRSEVFSTIQGFGNCGIEAARLLIQGATGRAPAEMDILREATRNGTADMARLENGVVGGAGGTYLAGRAQILKAAGVDATLTPQNPRRGVSGRRGGERRHHLPYRRHPLGHDELRRSRDRGHRRPLRRPRQA